MKRAKSYVKRHFAIKLMILLELIEYGVQLNFLLRYSNVIASSSWTISMFLIHISTSVCIVLLSFAHKFTDYMDIAMGIDCITDLYFAFSTIDNLQFLHMSNIRMVIRIITVLTITYIEYKHLFMFYPNNLNYYYNNM